MAWCCAATGNGGGKSSPTLVGFCENNGSDAQFVRLCGTIGLTPFMSMKSTKATTNKLEVMKAQQTGQGAMQPGGKK